LRRGVTIEMQATETLPIGCVSKLLDSVGTPVLIADRNGRILMMNESARHCLNAPADSENRSSNLFQDLLHMDAEAIVGQVESGEHELDLEIARPEGKIRAHVEWLREKDWILVRLDSTGMVQKDSLDDSTGQPTVQALLQEREITYRNLLAAYLRLQEVNRQKTVFLASAAHELKTPLAVIKGYYDLLLSGSLGHLNDKQRDILQESKESCERLVRLVSMFLNYSTLESGKLVLHLRENDLRDCLLELSTRWTEAFQRKRVRLDVSIDEGLPSFRFDYQKVQQAVANLLDNALKHTPVGGSVTMRAERHFWERRNGKDIPSTDRRRAPSHAPNSACIAVTDTGPGIATEHHQEIFEDFVRVDRTSSGMGLGLAIAKRLVQAHRGKIWVESTPRQGCTFTFLLPTDTPQQGVRNEG
jgi:signal transduction histidine kinase